MITWEREMRNIGTQTKATPLNTWLASFSNLPSLVEESSHAQWELAGCLQVANHLIQAKWNELLQSCRSHSNLFFVRHSILSIHCCRDVNRFQQIVTTNTAIPTLDPYVPYIYHRTLRFPPPSMNILWTLHMTYWCLNNDAFIPLFLFDSFFF